MIRVYIVQVQRERRKNDPDLGQVEETTVNWVDSPTQKLDVELVLQLVGMIGATLREGETINPVTSILLLQSARF